MSRLVFRRELPRRLALPVDGLRPHRFVVVYDRRFGRASRVRSWLEGFPLRYPVTAGESLKSVDRLADHLRRLLRMVPDATRRNTTLVGLGGGSVGDFVGFAASILKRGVGLIHVPTTWLAALDSAHGGKTALNVDGVKNQIGTFYPAGTVIAVRSLLASLSRADTMSGLGELVKIGVIEGGPLFEELSRPSTVSLPLMWRVLPRAIEAKMRIVRADPEERSGKRQLLNLGHSLGHALESHYRIPHGIAVAHGLRFAVEWSVRRKRLSRHESGRILRLLDREPELDTGSLSGRRLTAARLSALLARDKKAASSGSMHFVFIRRVGRVTTEAVSLQSVVAEAKRQGWI